MCPYVSVKCQQPALPGLPHTGVMVLTMGQNAKKRYAQHTGVSHGPVAEDT
jgi:hypothetical protein